MIPTVANSLHNESQNNGDNLEDDAKVSLGDDSLLQLFVESDWEKAEMKNLGNWLLSRGIDISAKNRFIKNNEWQNSCASDSEADAFKRRIAKELWYALHILLKCNGDINYTDNNGQTILHAYFSCILAHESSYAYRIHEYEALYESRVGGRATESASHCKSKFRRIVKSLIDRGASVNAIDVHGETPVHVAADIRSVELMDLMLDSFDQVHVCNTGGDTTLHKLLYQMDYEDYNEKKLRMDDIRDLLSKGADPNKRNRLGQTPLQYAIRYCNVDLLRIFEQYAADFSVFTPGNDNLLHAAIRFGSPDNSRDKFRLTEVVDFLVERGCDVNAVNDAGFSVLHVAADWGFSLERMLKLGADVNLQTNKRQQTALHLAIKKQGYEYYNDDIRALVYAGADWDAIDRDGLKPLHYALKDKRWSSPFFILECGASINDCKTRILAKDCDVRTQQAIHLRLIALEAMGLPIDDRYELEMDEQQRSYWNSCLKEVDAMKTCMISDNVSIYQFVHMNWKRQLAFVDHLPQDLRDKFPIYDLTIRIACNQAARRNQLIGPAKRAGYRIFETLTDLCVDRILDFLNNWTLKVLIDIAGTMLISSSEGCDDV